MTLQPPQIEVHRSTWIFFNNQSYHSIWCMVGWIHRYRGIQDTEGWMCQGLVPITPCCLRVHCTYWEFSICRTLHASLHSVVTRTIIIPIFQMRRLRHWEIKWFIPGPRVAKWQKAGVQTHMDLIPKPVCLTLFYLSLTHTCIQQSRSWQNSQYLP